MALEQVQQLFREGFDIGIGVASASGSPMALGVIGAVTPPQVGSGGSGSFTFRRVDTTDDLTTELGIGADVSGGIGLFRGSASLDFAKKCRIQANSLSVLVAAEERFAFQQIDSPELSPTAKSLTGDPARFTEQFGDYFIRGISTGGRFIGVIRIDTQSTQAKESVDTALSSSYGISIDADARIKIASVLSAARAKAEAFIIFDGGRITTRPTSRDPIELVNQLYKAMDEWTATVHIEPKAYSVTLAPYAIALGSNPPNTADLEHQRDVLIRCAKLRASTIDKLNFVEYILDHSHINEFDITPPPEGPDLRALQAALAKDLDVIADAASFAINNVKEARSPEDFMADVRLVPGFQFTALPTLLPKHSGATARANLSGSWSSGVTIAVSGDVFTVDMSSHNRPNAHGVIVDSSTIKVTFPDDAIGTYTCQVEMGKITLSNNSVWLKV